MTTLFAPNENAVIAERLRSAYRISEAASCKSAFEYLKHCIIDSKPEPQRYVDVARDWQKGLASCILPAVEYAAGVRKSYEGPRNFWLTLPRGHDKTGMLARLSSWFIGFSTSPKSCVAAAVDRDQANILLESMKTEAALNPWLKKRLTFMNYKVIGHQGSVLKAVSSDAYSSFGYRSDLMVFDELTHWKDRGLWDAIFSGRHKIDRAVLVIITNAGVLGSWQHEILEKTKELHGKSWFIYEVPPHLPLSNWMSSAEILEAERLLPPAVAKRVIHNVWIDPGEDCGFISAADVSLCEELGRSRALTRKVEGEPGYEYFVSIDYAPVKDRTALAVIHKAKDGMVIVDRLDIMQGRADRRVSIEAVEAWLDNVRKKFRIALVVIDPYQMESTCQKFEGLLPVERCEARGGKTNYALASNLRSLLVNQNIAWYPDAGLVINNGKEESFGYELKNLIIRQLGYGWRLDTMPGGFDDRSVAVAQAALYCIKQPKRLDLRTSSCYF